MYYQTFPMRNYRKATYLNYDMWNVFFYFFWLNKHVITLVYSGYYHLDQKSMTGIAVGVGIALTCILICVLILIYRSKARCVSLCRRWCRAWVMARRLV